MRSGFYVSAENTAADNTSTVLPLDTAGNPIDAPFNVTDDLPKLGWLLGVYMQDEWKLTDTAHAERGHTLRSDVSVRRREPIQPARQSRLQALRRHDVPCRLCALLHASVPSRCRPVDLSAVQNTTQQPTVNQDDPVLPERSHYFDAGVTQKILPGLELGVDGYYKRAQDLLDDGQFGAALVLDAFNYAKGINEGIEVRPPMRTAASKLMETSRSHNRKPLTSFRTSFCLTQASSLSSLITSSTRTTRRS